jgi:RNA polymerase sigma-70 factor (ECF subfamily)
MSDSPVVWGEVAAKLQPYIARRVPAADVDDVIQDVLIRMHRGFGALRDEDRFTGWMFKIASHAIAERGRDRGRHPVAEAVEIADAPLAQDDDRVAAEALAACLTMFVARLESPYREAVTLVELEGRTAREAAELIGLSVSGMKSRVQRGRAQLRAMLEACCEIAVDPRGKVTDVTPRGLDACCPPSRSRD